MKSEKLEDLWSSASQDDLALARRVLQRPTRLLWLSSRPLAAALFAESSRALRRAWPQSPLPYH